jgi:hypothetical protein
MAEAMLFHIIVDNLHRTFTMMVLTDLMACVCTSTCSEHHVR